MLSATANAGLMKKAIRASNAFLIAKHVETIESSENSKGDEGRNCIRNNTEIRHKSQR